MQGILRADFAGLANVRLIQDRNRWVVPVVDIAEAIDYRRAWLQFASRSPTSGIPWPGSLASGGCVAKLIPDGRSPRAK